MRRSRDRHTFIVAGPYPPDIGAPPLVLDREFCFVLKHPLIFTTRRCDFKGLVAPRAVLLAMLDSWTS